jgi:hypothetical protein
VDAADAILVSPAGLGATSLTVGDPDGDGYDGFALGGSWGGGAGAVRIFEGPLPATFTFDDNSAFLHEDQAYADFGVSASMEQDLDADGRSDLVAGAPYVLAGEWGGADFVFYGPLEGAIDTDNADAVFRVWTGGEPFVIGTGFVAPGGDVNQDGYGDFFASGCTVEELPCYTRCYGVFGGMR